jgi:hypothetical protein
MRFPAQSAGVPDTVIVKVSQLMFSAGPVSTQVLSSAETAPTAVPCHSKGNDAGDIVPELGLAAFKCKTDTTQAKLRTVKTTNKVQRFLFIMGIPSLK